MKKNKFKINSKLCTIFSICMLALCVAYLYKTNNFKLVGNSIIQVATSDYLKGKGCVSIRDDVSKYNISSTGNNIYSEDELNKIISGCGALDEDDIADILLGKRKLTYDDFYAKGDGINNDYLSIRATHEFANRLKIDGYDVTVYATSSATSDVTYYISNADSIDIITDVDWQGVNFIIDDYIDQDGNNKNDISVNALKEPLFVVRSEMYVASKYDNLVDSPVRYLRIYPKLNLSTSDKVFNILSYITSSNFYQYDYVKKSFDSADFIAAKIVSSNTPVYIRSGTSEDAFVGNNMQENIIIDAKTGKILTDITWNWSMDDISYVDVYPVPLKAIKISNASFTTYSYNKVSGNYYKRGLSVSYTGNVVFSNINHMVDETIHENLILPDDKYFNCSTSDVKCLGSAEKEKHGNKYNGFYNLSNASNIIFKDIVATPRTVGIENYGTYDMRFDYSTNVVLYNVYQCEDGDLDCYNTYMINPIKWGVNASNYTKNLYVINSKLNRIDAHQGIHNLYFDKTNLGNKAITVVGFGDLYVKDTTIDGSDKFIYLRDDYGSSFNGNIIIKNSTLNTLSSSTQNSVIYSWNKKINNYGYKSYFPNLYINGFKFNNNNSIDDYEAGKRSYLIRLAQTKLLKTKQNCYDAHKEKSSLFSQLSISTSDSTRENYYNCIYNAASDTDSTSYEKIKKTNICESFNKCIAYTEIDEDDPNKKSHYPFPYYFKDNIYVSNLKTDYKISLFPITSTDYYVLDVFGENNKVNVNIDNNSINNFFSTNISKLNNIATSDKKFYINTSDFTTDENVIVANKVEIKYTYGRDYIIPYILDVSDKGQEYEINNLFNFRDGYIFKEWNTKSDGSGTTYNNNSIIKLDGNIELYAKWTPITYSIKYNSNGGTGSMNNQDMTYDTSLNLNPNIFKKTGYTFKEWNTKSDGTGTSYKDKTSIKNLTTTNGSEINLYAIWEESYSYDIDKKYELDKSKKIIHKISEKTQVSEFKKAIKLNTNYTVEVESKKNLIYTGSKTKIYKNNVLYDELTNIVLGDTTGDGVVNIADVSKLYRHLRHKITMEDIYVQAGNVVYTDDKISINDVSKLYRYLKRKIINLE